MGFAKPESCISAISAATWERINQRLLLNAQQTRVEKASQVSRDPLLGHMFENLVVIECLKTRTNAGKLPNLYFFRDSNGNEVDVLF